MATALAPEIPIGGFSFRNFQRNLSLMESGYRPPKVTKTGTTIVGLTYGNGKGIVLGADTRATGGDIVADKNCEKIHKMSRRIYCCGAGTAADCEKTTAKIASQLELLRLNMGRETPVISAASLLREFLYRYQGYISAALVLGGVDYTGAHLYTISPNGYVYPLPYTTMGSGSLNAMSVFDDHWKPDLTEEQGIQLVRDAIAAGIKNDMGSGSNIDVAILHQDRRDVIFKRNMEIVGIRGERKGTYSYIPGTTRVLKTEVIPLEIVDDVEEMEVGDD